MTEQAEPFAEQRALLLELAIRHFPIGKNPNFDDRVLDAIFESYQAGAADAQARIAELEARISAIIIWLEKNQIDVFERGLWDVH